MIRAEYIACVALVVSLASLGLGIFNAMRDRAKLKVTSEFFAPERARASIRISVVNQGRRPIILRMWVCANDEGNWFGNFFKDQVEGLRLAEHERIDQTIFVDDLLRSDENDVIIASDLWIEDTLGRKHRPRKVKKHIRQLMNSLGMKARDG